jgi:hypothetical protein
MTFLSIDPPLDITGPFYLGVELPTTAGDTLALLTNKKGQSVPCTAWEQWRNGSWYQYSDTNSWGYNVSHAIFPVICKQDYGINAEPENSIVLYPNPASSYITVNSDKWTGSKLSLKLYNIMGMQVLESEYNENHGAQIDVNISRFKTGVYFIRLSDGKSFYTGKFNVIR